MNKNQVNHIRNHKVTPRPQAWDRVSAQLDAGEHKKNAEWYKWSTVAALMLCILSVVVLIQRNLSDDLLGSDDFSQSLVFLTEEDKAQDTRHMAIDMNGETSIYSLKSVERVSMAYDKLKKN